MEQPDEELHHDKTYLQEYEDRQEDYKKMFGFADLDLHPREHVTDRFILPVSDHNHHQEHEDLDHFTSHPYDEHEVVFEIDEDSHVHMDERVPEPQGYHFL